MNCRRTVIEIAEQKNIPIEEKNLTVEDLKAADEVLPLELQQVLLE